MADRDFEQRFNILLKANPTISAALNPKKFKHTSSNILLKLRAQRANLIMLNEIEVALQRYGASDKVAYTNAVRQSITNYVNISQRAIGPRLQKLLQAPSDDPAEMLAYERYIRFTIGQATQQATTLKIKLDVLSNGKAAYQINNKDRKSVVSKVGDWIDRNPKASLFASI